MNKQSLFNFFNARTDWFSAFTNGKNLRVAVILIGIYHMIISQILLFVMLLGLTHADKMVSILLGDITDQKEREEYYEMPVNSNGESMNQVRFRAASELAASTRTSLFGGVAMATLYVCACFGLLFGTLKYRHEGIASWLVVQVVYEIVLISCAYAGVHYGFRDILGEHVKCFWFLVVLNVGVDCLNWLVVYSFYSILKEMKKLTKSATVWIPCPQPGNVQFRKENMYLGDGGHKHTLTENDLSNPNYVV